MKYFATIAVLGLLSCFVAFAGTERTVDITSFTTPIHVSTKTNTTQLTQFSVPLMLNAAQAHDVFATGSKTLTITNLPVPPNGTAVVNLELCRPVFDANSKFLVNTPQGKKPIKVRPIYSYKGEVEGEPGSKVSLHYSDGDLTGYIFHPDGSRTVIGRANEYRAVEGAYPHAFESEGANGRPLALSNFMCGADELPVDERAAVTAMAMPSSMTKGMDVQGYPLKDLRLALVLREDVDSVLRLQGLNEEQVAQHFAKIVAAMSQAYEEELGVHMYIGYLLSFTEEAPSGYIYDGYDPGELLNEFSQDWSTGYNDVERHAAHLYCLQRSKGGVFVAGIAYGGQSGPRLCNNEHRGAYGVSTVKLNVSEQIPGQAGVRNGFVWDVYVAAHEIGHNIGAPHTHNCIWNPPVDTCQLQSDGTDACYNLPSLRRVRPGTIMSYCHLVNGSTSPLTFSTRVAERMRTWIDASCMTVSPEPIVRITSPRGYDEWKGGAKVPIKWVSAMVSNVNLDYSLDGTSNWKSIAKDLNAADQLYTWTVPAINANRIWIRISSSTDVNVQNISIASYRIDVPLTLQSPSGGERIGIGTEFQIRWSKDNSVVSGVNVLFSADDGATWESLAQGQTTTSYAWTVNSAPTTTARIKVVSASNSSISATSEQFAIGAPRFELLLPKEGGELCNNFDNQYNWSADFIDRIKIQYSTDGGGSWRNAVQPLTVGASQWQIFSLNSGLKNIAAGTKVKLRVIESASETVLSTRDELTIAECSAVTSVDDVATAVGTLSLTASPNPANGSTMLTINHSADLGVSVVAVDVSGTQTTLIPSMQLSGSGATVVPISLEKLPQGAYRLVVRSEGVQADVPVRVVR